MIELNLDYMSTPIKKCSFMANKFCSFMAVKKCSFYSVALYSQKQRHTPGND
jgi:hypothetical protein